MKQGSADDPFADGPDDEDDAAEDAGATEQQADSAATGHEPGEGRGTRSATASGSASAEGSATDERRGASTDQESNRSETPQRRSLPYIHARDGVKDGRTQRPVFLRDHVETGIDELVAEMEAQLGEDVYKTDVTEAAMAAAQENPELVLAKLEEWGYGWS